MIFVPQMMKYHLYIHLYKKKQKDGTDGTQCKKCFKCLDDKKPGLTLTRTHAVPTVGLSLEEIQSKSFCHLFICQHQKLNYQHFKTKVPEA